MLISVPVDRLQPGMYVAELDRPWIGLPFLLEGLLLENERDIAVLRAHCAVVRVDPERSTVALAAPAAENPSPLGRVNPGAAEPPAFFDVLKAIQLDLPFERPARPPAVNPVNRRSDLSEEILYSATIVKDGREAVRALMENVELSEKVDLERVAGFVENVSQGVARNPDAMIWLARLKRADDYTYDHAIDVSIFAMVFGSFIGLRPGAIEQLGLIGLLQDIGKVHLSPDLLGKSGPLDPEELAMVRSHVASSLEILSRQARFDATLISAVSRHHERHDGSGYPRQLSGERIGLMAEIAGLIDTYCAMTRKRPYGPPVSTQHAVASLVALRGGKFREALIDEFVQCIGIYPVGSLVELNTGEVAVVIQKNQIRRMKPKLMVLLGPDKSPERRPRLLDLMFDPPAPDGGRYQIVRSLPIDAYGVNPDEFYLS